MNDMWIHIAEQSDTVTYFMIRSTCRALYCMLKNINLNIRDIHHKNIDWCPPLYRLYVKGPSYKAHKQYFGYTKRRQRYINNRIRRTFKKYNLHEQYEMLYLKDIVNMRWITMGGYHMIKSRRYYDGHIKCTPTDYYNKVNPSNIIISMRQFLILINMIPLAGGIVTLKNIIKLFMSYKMRDGQLAIPLLFDKRLYEYLELGNIYLQYDQLQKNYSMYYNQIIKKVSPENLKLCYF